MVESEAQGRLPGIHPVSVVDIGSNSVRLVIYEGLSRAPSVLFNEKVLCGLGKGLVATGRMDESGIARALAALQRFRALSEQARASEMHVLATAAAREAENGPSFINDAETILGCRIRVLTGEQEARFSALGIIAGYFEPDGIVGDLGGGSLELADIKGNRHSGGQTLPLGGLRLAEMSGDSISKARDIVRQSLRKSTVLAGGAGRTFYAVGGTWRNIAKLHMDIVGYPLHMMQAYEIDAKPAIEFLSEVASMKQSRINAIKAISRNRRGLLPYGAVALQETLITMKAARVSFSALGVREGYLYSLLGAAEAARDPLLTAAGELAILRARSPEHARELVAWTGRMFPVFGVNESVEDSRYRQAACLLADISWRAHPDYRGPQALNVIAHGTFTGISHGGRAYIALANYFRFEGLNDDGISSGLAAIAGTKYLDYAKLLGGLLRVVYLFSASMPGMVPQLEFVPAVAADGDVDIVLKVPRSCGVFVGERLDGRLQQLAKLTGKRLGFRVG